ncbi:hypothetical protein ABQF17_17535 [Mycolicibacterium elephantis]
MSALDHAALAVRCPVCAAAPGDGCRTSRSRLHVPRVQRGLNRRLRDQARTHERIWRALRRVRAAAEAGQPVADADLTTALGSCGCAECRAQAVPIVVELHELGLLPSMSALSRCGS